MIDAPPARARRLVSSVPSLAILTFAARSRLLKRTVPIALLGVPVAPRLLVVASGLVLLELAPAAGVSGRSMVLRILAVDAFISLMTAGDVVAFRINRRFLSVLSLPLVPYLPHLGDAISSAIHPGDALLLVDLVVLALIAALLPRSEAFSGAGPSRFLAGVGVATLVLGAGTDPYWRYATLRNPATAGHASLLPFHLIGTVDAFWNALRARYFAEQELSLLQRWYAERRPRKRAGGPLVARAVAARFENLVIVQVESLQAWAVEMRLGDQEVAPTLNRLRARGVS